MCTDLHGCMSTIREVLELETYRAIQNKLNTFKIYYTVTGAPW